MSSEYKFKNLFFWCSKTNIDNNLSESILQSFNETFKTLQIQLGLKTTHHNHPRR